MNPIEKQCAGPARAPVRRFTALALALTVGIGLVALLPDTPPEATLPDDPKVPALGAASAGWRLLETADGSSAGARHETSGVEVGGRIYVIGGRGNRPMRVFDPAARTWRTLPSPPGPQIHHFQPVAIDDTIYTVGAMICCYPDEPTDPTIHAFDTITQTWSKAGTVPAARARGGAGAVAHEGWIYIVGGNTNGHSGGAVPWFDRYRPATDTWEELADAPHARDHFQAAIVDGRIVAAGGRRTSYPDTWANPVLPVDVHDLQSGEWSVGASIPTPRAGTVTVAHEGDVIVLGGEIDTSGDALRAVEAFDVDTGRWRVLPPLVEGRHGSAAALVGETLHIVAGSRQRGGRPETDSHETLALGDASEPDVDRDDDGLSNEDEIALHGTDPDDPDTDDDGLDDSEEIELDTSPVAHDSDADGLSDGAEVRIHRTDPGRADSDDDDLGDGAEIDTHGTDPLVADTDGDGLGDGAEVHVHGTDPRAADTDGDGVDDGAEVAAGSDPTALPAPSPTPEPTPEAAPEPAPEPTPERTPDPVPAPSPAPLPATAPNPATVPVPVPISVVPTLDEGLSPTAPVPADATTGGGGGRGGGSISWWAIALLGAAGGVRRCRAAGSIAAFSWRAGTGSRRLAPRPARSGSVRSRSC